MSQTTEQIDAEVLQHFGADALSLAQAMRNSADPLADAATQALMAQREYVDAVQLAVVNGMNTVPNLPEPVQALLRDAEPGPTGWNPSG